MPPSASTFEPSTFEPKATGSKTGSVATSASPPGTGGVPAWAKAEYFQRLAEQHASKDALLGGSGLNVRLQAMQKPVEVEVAAAEPAETPTRRRGQHLLARTIKALSVMGGVPMSAEAIAQAPKAVHLTRPENVDGILREGLRPTTGLYKNLTTYFRDAVYLFPQAPTAVQKFANFSSASSHVTATVEVDLAKLDPEKLYKRVLDGALIYISNDPIPPEALRLREASP